jgi:hypothetical protein
VAHIGYELGLVLAGDLEFTALLADLLEQSGVLNRNRGSAKACMRLMLAGAKSPG